MANNNPDDIFNISLRSHKKGKFARFQIQSGGKTTLVKQFISIFDYCPETDFVKHILSLAKKTYPSS